MSGYPEDRPDRNNADDDREVAAARSATGAPGMLLLLNGLFGMLVVAVLSVPTVFQPELTIKFARDMVAQQPQGQERQDAEKQLDEAENNIQQNRATIQLKNAAQLGVLAVANLLAIFAGLAMRSLGSYGLSLTGAIVSVIPLVTGCCCTGIPFGLWAVIVLLRPEVKAGYSARRRAAYAPDRF